MAVEKEIIVAIEFGSSKIRGMAGCKNIDGSVQVLDVEQVDARNCIRKGVVYNVEKTVMCLRHIVEKMETALGMRLCRVFVGIGGRSLKGKINTVSRQLVTKTVISQELVDSLLKNNENTVYAGCEILDVIPQEYRVGTEATTDPVGVLGNQIEGTFLNVVARTEVREYIIRCVEAAGLEVAGVFVSPMALAGCVLTDTERRSGCALVDFGYGTTTVAVYKNNLLRHLAVIPLGGNNITQDLCTQQMEEDEAEDLKIKYGSAYSDLNQEELAKNLLMNNGRTIEERVLVDIVEARGEEIIKNVGAQIKNSGYKGKLLAGIFVSGAAANIKNMDKAIVEFLQVEKVRFVRTVPFALHGEAAGQVLRDGSLNTLLALVGEGNLNCVEPKPVEEKEEVAEEEVTVPTQEYEAEAEERSEAGGKEKDEDGGNEKKSKPGFWAKMKERLEKFANSVSEE